jgi:hypothetical protein
MTAYLSYLMGDVLGLSGILALFVCAVAISHYALHNISGACVRARLGVAGEAGEQKQAVGSAAGQAGCRALVAFPAGRLCAAAVALTAAALACG